jgi:hypothetical protein
MKGVKIMEKIQSGQVQLMKPLFVNGMFNREDKRIRAKYVRTIQYNRVEYHLWVSSGKNEKDYPRSENDTHYIMIQAGDYLVPCGYTEYDLGQRSGYYYLNKEWYGDFEGRNKFFNELRKDKPYEEYDHLVKEQVAKEEEFIANHCNDDSIQAEFLKVSFIDHCIETYIDARDNNGRYADFHGAAFLGELDQCCEISKRLKEIRKKEDEIKRAELEEKERLKQEEVLAEKNARRAEFYGWADSFTNIRFGKIYETMSKSYRYDGVIMTRLQFVIAKIKEGFYPKQKDNVVTYYGSRWDVKESKPKTEYRLVDDSNSYYKITKTEFDFTNYLINNNIFKKSA